MIRVPVGGRGKIVPYETITIRVPVPIRDAVDDLAARFRDKIFGTNFTEDDIDAKKIERLGEIIERYKSLSKNTRDWVHANKLIAELEAAMGEE